MTDEQTTDLDENATDVQPDAGATQQDAQSELKKFMESKGFESEEQVLNYINEQEQERVSLQEDYNELANKPQEPQKSDVPKDNQDFINKFAAEPQKVLENVIQTQLKPFQERSQLLEKELAIQQLINSKDYYDGMENDISSVIRKNRNMLITLNDGSRAQLAQLGAADKVRVAQQLLRESKKAKNLNSSKTPVKVTTPQKSATDYESKDDSELTADQMKKKYGLKVANVY